MKFSRRVFVEKLHLDHAGSVKTSADVNALTDRDSSRDHLRAVWKWLEVSSFWLSFCLKVADEKRHERLREKRHLVMGVDSADEFDFTKMTGITREQKLARDFCEKAEDSKLGHAILQQLREAMIRFAGGNGSGRRRHCGNRGSGNGHRRVVRVDVSEIGGRRSRAGQARRTGSTQKGPSCGASGRCWRRNGGVGSGLITAGRLG